MTKPAVLEEFDVSEYSASPVDGGVSEDWQHGHTAGFQEGQELAQNQRSHLSSQLVQRLQDMSFGYSEARAELLQQLGPLFEAISNAMSPNLGKELLTPRVCATLLEEADRCLDAPLIVAVSQSQIDAVSQALEDITALPFVAQADPTLSDGQAIISSGNHEVMIDLDGLLEDIRNTLGNLIPRHSKGTAHG